MPCSPPGSGAFRSAPALAGIFLSWMLRIPVITAWSAPGTALLITLFPAMSLQRSGRRLPDGRRASCSPSACRASSTA